MWTRFFNSFAGAADPAAEDGDTESIVSGSELPHTPNRSHVHQPSVDTPMSELAPGDSASVIHDDESAATRPQTSMTALDIVSRR